MIAKRLKRDFLIALNFLLRKCIFACLFYQVGKFLTTFFSSKGHEKVYNRILGNVFS